jgi:hypothetical protein
LLGPSPYDDITSPPKFPGGYNAVMQHLGDIDRQLAQQYGAAFISLNPGTIAGVEKAQSLDPRIAKLLIPDRVHPEATAHWFMAEALLKGWNAPALVSSVTIDAKAARLTTSENTSVSQLQRSGDGLTWTDEDDALPLPFERSNAGYALLLDLTDIEQALNQQPLIVTGLPSGKYALRIDDRDVATFSDQELAAGVNLAEYNTPMILQAHQVTWNVRDLVETHFIHSRMRMYNAENGAEEGGADRMQAFEDSMEDRIYAEAAPKPHRFELKPVAGATTQP